MKPIDLKYLLRWRFDYHDGKVKYGQWNSAGDKEDMTTKAWCISKDGLSRASIEGKDFQTRQIKTMVECTGDNFCNFEWVANSPGLIPGGKSYWTPPVFIRGLAMVTRENRVAVYVNGRAENRKKTEFEKNFHYAGYGR